MEKVKAYRHDLCPSDAAHGIRGYACENGWFVEFNEQKGALQEHADLHYDGKCVWVDGEALERLKNKLELIEPDNPLWHFEKLR